MNQLQEVQAQFEQWKAMGLGLNDLQAAAQTAYTGGTTPLGLSQWSLGDKPRMEDFNRDNARVDELIAELRGELGKKAEIGNTPQSNLPLPAGTVYSSSSRYGKTQTGVVICNFAVKKEDESPFASQDVIATLPEGFRPVNVIYSLAFTDSLPISGTRQMMRVRVRPSGEIDVHSMAGVDMSQVNVIGGSIMFFAVQ